jgi:hypothetical protein
MTLPSLLATALTLALTVALAESAPPSRERPPKTDRQVVADLCDMYGELAALRTMDRDRGLSFNVALAKTRRDTAGMHVDEMVASDREEITAFVYINPSYSPQASRDYVSLWYTWKWLPVAKD